MIKLCHIIWIQGEDALNQADKIKYEKIKQLNPDWAFTLWDDNSLQKLLGEKYPSILKIYQNVDDLTGVINPLTTKSDIGRFAVIREFGGMYFDIDFMCKKSFNKLFSDYPDLTQDVYICSSEIGFLSKIGLSSSSPKYCSCFFYFKEKNSPLWEEVFKKIEESTEKQTIGESLDTTLQANESVYKIKIFDMVKGHYSCCDNYICTTPPESSWNDYRPLLKFLNCNFYTIIAIILVLFTLCILLKFVGFKFTCVIILLVFCIIKYRGVMTHDRVLLEIKEEHYKDANTVFKKYNKSIIIAGALRDVSDTCEDVLSSIDSIRKQFEKSTVILYENDSRDDTVNIVKKWAQDKRDIVLLLNQVNQEDTRTKRIGIARQTIIDYIKQNQSLREYDYLLCLDFGSENSSKKLSNTIHHAVDTMCERQNVIGIFPSNIDYYDNWPLRVNGLIDYDVHTKFIPILYMWFIGYKMGNMIKEAREKNEMIVVESAFGGAGFYRLKSVINSDAKYDGTDTCEHTSFNRDLLEYNRGSILVIHPYFEIGSWIPSYTSTI